MDMTWKASACRRPGGGSGRGACREATCACIINNPDAAEEPPLAAAGMCDISIIGRGSVMKADRGAPLPPRAHSPRPCFTLPARPAGPIAAPSLCLRVCPACADAVPALPRLHRPPLPRRRVFYSACLWSLDGKFLDSFDPEWCFSKWRGS